MKETLRGRFETWNLFSTRNYADIHLPYHKFIELMQPVTFNATNGKGEQRSLIAAHVKKLKSEIMSGNYTPTQCSANLTNNHRKNLKIDESGCTFELEVDSNDPLSLTDGGHRTEVFAQLLADTLEELETASEKDRPRLQNLIDTINNLSIGVRIYFDGLAKRDFLNLQAGRPVDSTHLATLKILQGKDPVTRLAFETAKALNSGEGPFRGLIRLDSRVNPDSLVRQIPFSTLCARSAGDLSTSLIGLAKVALSIDGDATGKQLAALVTDVYGALEAECPTATEKGRALTPILKGGTKGSSTMLIGLAICYLYQGNGDSPDDDLRRLCECVRESLDCEIEKNFSGATKRQLIGDFAEKYFAGTDEETHDNLPLRLLETLSPSAYNAAAFPKRRKNAVVEEEELVTA